MTRKKKFVRNSPHLPVKNLQATIACYHETLGFADEWTFGNKDGGILRDDLWPLFGEDPEFTNDTNNKNNHLPLMWFVNNIEEIYEEFKKKKY